MLVSFLASILKPSFIFLPSSMWPMGITYFHFNLDKVVKKSYFFKFKIKLPIISLCSGKARLVAGVKIIWDLHSKQHQMSKS